MDAYRSFSDIPSPEFGVVEAKDLLDNVRRLLRAQIEEKALSITVSVDPPDPTLTADPDLLDQVLINLALNAIQAVENQTEARIELRAYVDRRSRPVIQKALASPPPDRTTAVSQSSSSDGSESTDASEVGDHSSNEAAAHAGSPPDRKEAQPLPVREKETLQSFAYRLQRLRALRADGTLSETEHRRARREALADAEKIVAASQLSREILIDIVKEMKDRGQVTTGDVARVREDPY